MMQENEFTAKLTARNFITPEDSQVVRTTIGGQKLLLCIRNLNDRIQRKHSRGKFYEPDELEIIKAHFPKGGVFCDIGANIGNHSLYAAKFLNASRCIVFEPNPDAYDLLMANAALNGVEHIFDVQWLGRGVGDVQSDNMGLSSREDNLGATRMVAGTGSIEVRRGDEVLDGCKIDFVKIDVEGMEIDVLQGLTNTLKTSRPVIFLEVEHVNRDALSQWCEQHGYKIGIEGRRFRHNQNLLLIPT